MNLYPRSLETAIYLYLTSQRNTQGMVDWAVERLCEGADGKFTTLLAGATPADSDSLKYWFQNSVEEQGARLPGTPLGELRFIEYYVCSRGLAGEFTPCEILSHGYHLCWTSDYEAQFIPWLELDDSISQLEDYYQHRDWYGGPLTKERIPEVTLQLAREVVERANAAGAPYFG
jgi:hypothetical protein